ncbi:MAG: hypothetical protein H0V43_04165 [Gemmatimonadales bacterium]|nr:hypothetical protein [Gemmatimonadales bacterium]MBA3553228.1 hypothetical protein [Gemmatimonadales bacterium]
MPRTTRLIALGTVAVLAGCGERTSPEPIPDAPEHGPAAVSAGRGQPHAARERLARRFALALADPSFRARVKGELDRSPMPERKLHLQRFLTGTARSALRDLARAGREADAAVETDVSAAPALEFYLPVLAHRSAWRGDDRILVATAHADGEAPVAFTTAGRRVILDPNTPPDTPVLAVVPVEADFDRLSGMGQLKAGPGDAGGGGGGVPSPPPPPAGLYMTYAHFTDQFEGWLKGSPEFEVHMLGQSGTTDSLASYSCAGEHAGGYYRFDQNGLDWSGNVLLISQAQLNLYRSAHPNQNMRVFVVEDDDTSCQIKADVNRFGALIKAVETAYPQLGGGRDSTSSLQRWWKRADALQKLIKAVASFIVTNDELVGNAVESAVVGVSYPGANWVVKGESNRTTGWINLVLR